MALCDTKYHDEKENRHDDKMRIENNDNRVECEDKRRNGRIGIYENKNETKIINKNENED